MSSDYIPGTGLRGIAPEPAHGSSPVEPSGNSSPVLVIAAPAPAKPKFGSLFWLSHVMGLDIYGSTTLSYAARVDMNAAALVLTSILLFDLANWCLLFYFIVNSGSIGFNPARIVFALGGILPALALFLYERSFITADTKGRGWRRLLLPTAIRLCVILAAAWITAQPVEMLTFGQRIKDRVQEELIRKNIVGYYRELAYVRARQGNAPGSGQRLVDIVNQDIQDSRNKLDEARRQYDETNLKLINKTNNEKAAKEELDHALATARGKSKEDPNLDPAVKAAIAKHGKLREDVARLTGDLKRFEAQQQHAQEDLAHAQEWLPVEISRQDADVTKEGLDNWVRTLKTMPPGQDRALMEGKKLYEFTFVDYDFLDKFRIIDDVLSGRPPRWPGADQEMIADLKHQYGMYDLSDAGVDANSQGGRGDSPGNTGHNTRVDTAARERSLAETRNAGRTYWAIFGVAVIIPLLSLLFKLVMPPHLTYYYSSEWQAQQGNPWAIAMEAAIASMEDRRTSGKKARFSSDQYALSKAHEFPPEWKKRN